MAAFGARPRRLAGAGDRRRRGARDGGRRARPGTAATRARGATTRTGAARGPRCAGAVGVRGDRARDQRDEDERCDGPEPHGVPPAFGGAQRPSRQTSSAAPAPSRTVTSGTSRAPSSTATKTRIPAGRPPLATASGSAGVAATRVLAAAPRHVDRARGGGHRAEGPRAARHRIEVGLHQALGEDGRADADARARATGDVAARPSPAPGHREEDADRAHAGVVAGRGRQPPRDAALGAGRDVDLRARALGRHRPGRARGVGQRHRVGRPDRVAGGERGRDERQQREDEDEAARPAREQRAAWRASPRRAQVVAELGEDGVGVARAHVAPSGPSS